MFRFFSGCSKRLLLAEERKNVLSAGVGDRQRLDSQLLLRLQGRQASGFFFHVGIDQPADLIEINGSVELAPVLGLSDVIVDIVETGDTLRENGLDVLTTICEISSRLIVNQVSLKTKREMIDPIIKAFENQL